MKTTTYKNILLTFAISAAISSGFKANAQHQSVSTLLSNHTMKYSINSKEDYSLVEESISTLAAQLRDAHQKYPNLRYSPVYDNAEIVAFLITGVSKSSEADQLSTALMQIEILSNVIRTTDEAYIPNVDGKKLSKVSRKEASR